jgi:Family of unknown function (DUF6152)
MKIKVLSLACIAVAMSVLPAFAHHSFAMFDAEKKVTLEGAVKEFQWTNPHSWILMTGSNAQGQPALTPGMKVKGVI